MLIENENWKHLRQYAERCNVNYEVLMFTLGNNPLTSKKIKCISKNFSSKYPNVTLFVENLLKDKDVK